MALGLAACGIKKDYFTGTELYEELLKTAFSGASDFVSFDAETGSRKFVLYRVDNILMVNKGGGVLGFRQEPVAAMRADGVETLQDFIYWDNSTRVPAPLPELSIEYNSIPTSLRAARLALGCFMMVVSILCICWTIYYRGRDVVKSSQPFFLIQLCIGTFLMAASIIPMSFQEPMSTHGLDISCMMVPWLFVIGFVISFSSLLSKSWRINKLFSNGAKFKRVQVRVIDALFPLAILSAVNVALLTLWTILSPMRWERVKVDSFDDFGRSIESYGMCVTDGSMTSFADPDHRSKSTGPCHHKLPRIQDKKLANRL